MDVSVAMGLGYAIERISPFGTIETPWPGVAEIWFVRCRTVDKKPPSEHR